MGISFGYLINQQSGGGRDITESIQEAAAEALAAENSGFSGVYVSEHHQRADDYVPSPFPLAAYLAGVTSTVRIGVLIALVPLYHPLRLMEDAATLDIVSQGRSVLGLGLGYIDRDFAVYGLDRKSAAASYRDLIPVLSEGWTGPVNVTSPSYKIQLDEFTPKPPQSPRPPIWIAANTKLGVRLAARYGDCWVAGARIALSRAEELATVYRDECSRLGKSPHVAAIRDAWVADSFEDAWEESGKFLFASLKARVAHGLVPAPEQSLDPDEWVDRGATFRDLSRGRWLVGDLPAVKDEISEWVRRVGIAEAVVRFKQPTGPDARAVLKQITRWNREVMPEFATADHSRSR